MHGILIARWSRRTEAARRIPSLPNWIGGTRPGNAALRAATALIWMRASTNLEQYLHEPGNQS